MPGRGLRNQQSWSAGDIHPNSLAGRNWNDPEWRKNWKDAMGSLKNDSLKKIRQLQQGEGWREEQ